MEQEVEKAKVEVGKLILSLVLIVIACFLLIVRLNPDLIAKGRWEESNYFGAQAVINLTADKDGKIVFAGLRTGEQDIGGLAISTDKGKSWRTIKKFIPSTNDVTTILFNPDNNNEIFIGLFNNGKNGKGGVYFSSDKGKTWKRLSGEDGPPYDVRNLAIAKKDNKMFLIAGTVTNGVYISEDKGKNWIQKNKGLENLQVQNILVDPFSKRKIYLATFEGLYVSDDFCENWKKIGTGFNDDKPFILQLIAHPKQKGTIFCLYRTKGTRTYLMKSTDEGKSWLELGRKGTPAEFHPRCVVIDPEHPDTMFMGTIYDGIYRSDDGGFSWQAINRGVPIHLRRIIIHSMTIVNSKNPVLLAGSDMDGKIFRTFYNWDWWDKFINKIYYL